MNEFWKLSDPPTWQAN